MKFSTSAQCKTWGSDKNARRISGMTSDERKAVRTGSALYLSGAPEVRGVTHRRIVAIGKRFYCRMP